MKRLIILLVASMLFMPFGSVSALSSTDAWYQMQEDQTYLIYYDVMESSAGTWFAVGLDGMITSSMDDGSTWSTTTNTTMSLYAMTQSSYGLVIGGDSGTIISSEDEGDSWQSATTGTTSDINDVDCNGNYCVAAVSSYEILLSTDGGQGWSSALLAVGSDDFHGAHIGASGQAWVSGSGGTIKNLASPSEFFRAQTSGVSSTLLDIFFLDDEQTGWVVGDSGVFLETTDGGLTWIDSTFASTTFYHIAVNPSDDDHIFLVGSRDIYESTDGGDNWSSVSLDASLVTNFFSASVIDGNLIGAGFSSNGGVLVSDDTTSPSSPSSLGTNPSSPSTGQEPTFSWTASTDSQSGVEGYTILLDGKEISSVEDQDYTFSTLGEGTYVMGVYASDVVGNDSATSTISYTVDLSGPSIGSISPTTATTGVVTSFSATMTDVSSISSCEFFVEGVSNGFMSDNGSSYSSSYTFSSDGDYEVYIVCIDALNQDSTGSLETITVSDEPTTESSTESETSSSTQEDDTSDNDSTVDDVSSLSPDSLVKIECDGDVYVNDPCTAVYFYGSDNKRHAFPNEKVFYTWYDDFNDLTLVSADVMSDLTLGSNVTYHPGVRMVKFLSWNTVYTVSIGGTLRAIPSEDVATDLYGSEWNTYIDDISDAFFSNYQFGDDIEKSSDYDVDDELDSADSIDDDLDAKE